MPSPAGQFVNKFTHSVPFVAMAEMLFFFPREAHPKASELLGVSCHAG